jgi:glycerophosphoryl diester phosphodiesterase
MPLPLRTINYDLSQFTGDEFAVGETFLRITPTVTTVCEGIIVPAITVTFNPDTAGQGTFEAVPGDLGTPEFDYRAELYRRVDGGVSPYQVLELPRFRVPVSAGPFVLADLMAAGVPPAETTYWRSITQAEYDAAIDAADRAESAAASATDSASAAALAAYDSDAWLSVNRGPYRIAHRGLKSLFPQNTLYAYNQCLPWAEAVEMDLGWSSDGVVFCFHDTTVDALTNGTGAITTLSASTIDGLVLDGVIADAELQELAKIPRFSQVLQWAKRRGVTLFPEIKTPLNTTTSVDDVCQQVIDAEMSDQVIFQNFNISTVLRALDYSDRIRAGVLDFTASLTTMTDNVDALASYNGRGWLFALSTGVLANPSIVGYARQNRVNLGSFTIITQSEADALMEIGCKNIMTDIILRGAQ